MIRLLKIELLKVTSYKAFWFMIGFYLLLLALMIFGIPGLIDYVAEKSGEPTQFRIFKAIVFNFPDIWQNIAFVASFRYFIKIILGLIVIILITSEYHFITIRSNIISGYSKNDFLLGKIEFIFLLGIVSTVVLFLSGLYLGFIHSSSTAIGDIFGKMIYLLAYFIELVTFLLFSLLWGVLLKRTGLAFIGLFVYLIAEPIIEYNLPKVISPYLPLNAMNNIIQSPNTSLIKVKTPDFNFDFQEFVSFTDVSICVGYAVLFVFLTWWIIKIRDI
ncbi:MAG: hypothetical protein KDC05_01020 [Bacteroidales bacterium]|nr:hypothetical protein [Bacteroidales bacterium]